MEQIGINSNVYAGGKIFHIQTSGNIHEMALQSEVFEAGRVIMFHKKKLDDAQIKEYSTEETFREFLKTFHHEIAWELELLFFMRDKIRTINHPISNNKIGLLFLRKGLLDEAIAEFEYAIEKKSDLIEPFTNLGIAYIQKGNFSEAVRILKTGCELKPNFADLRNNLGLAYGKNQQYAEALEEYQTALKINPNYTIVHLNIAITYLESIQVHPDVNALPDVAARKAIVSDIFQKTLATNPDFATFRFYTFRFEKIIKHIQANAIKQALEIIQEIKDSIQKPNLDETIHGFYLKFLFGGAGKDEKVLSDYRIQLEKAVEENPQYADLHNSLGLVYLIQCRNLFLKAMGQFKKAYEINPSYKNAYKNFRLVQNDGREFLNLLRAILK
jgi:tetratricopeptide (TPR) repeat protein